MNKTKQKKLPFRKSNARSLNLLQLGKGRTLIACLPLMVAVLAASVAKADGPILETDYPAPDDRGDTLWGRSVCHNGTWLVDDPPRYEWTSVLDGYDPIVGVSGTSIRLEPDGISRSDMWFTHPFVSDFEFMIAPDERYRTLLSLANRGFPYQGEYWDGVVAAVAMGLSVPRGVLGLEVEQALIPPAYRPETGDRVAVFGTWIVDCGHDDDHTEIHPPLLIAKARTEGSSTVSHVIGRPYTVTQDFVVEDSRKALRAHLIEEITKVFDCPLWWLFRIPCNTQIEAHPELVGMPFSGVHLVSYLIRPPGPPNPGDRLVADYHFTVRSGVRVQLADAGDAIRVWVIFDETDYRPAALPTRYDRDIHFGDDPDGTLEEVMSGLTIVAGFAGPEEQAALGIIFARGIRTDRRDTPQATSPRDGEVYSFPETTTSVSVDNNQPFPIYGWVNARWIPPCTPRTCEAAGANCGNPPNGCGGTLSCGTCSPPNTCGGGGTAYQCGCTLTTCGSNCGWQSDGCGGQLWCGSCTCECGGIPPNCATCTCEMYGQCGTWPVCQDCCPPTCCPGSCFQGVCWQWC
jgi:hypothetical protein